LAFAVCAVLLVAGFLIARYQSYRIGKIDFIIWDNQHANDAGLSREKLTDYLQHCGANVDSSASKWSVSYDGFFQHRAWNFPFVSPPKDSAP
jgi:hypothetical protein